MRRLLEQGDAWRGRTVRRIRAHERFAASLANADAVAAYEGLVKERESALEIQHQQARVEQQRMMLIGSARRAAALPRSPGPCTKEEVARMNCC